MQPLRYISSPVEVLCVSELFLKQKVQKTRLQDQIWDFLCFGCSGCCFVCFVAVTGYLQVSVCSGVKA